MRTLIAFLLTLSATYAAPILNVNISPASQTGVPGQILTFSGTLENVTNNNVFINSNSLTFGLSGIGVLDDSLFLTNAPLFLGPLETTKPFDFFTVTIPTLQTPGLFTGVFTVLGGADDLAADILGSNASIQVQVSAPSAAIPEPATFLLLPAGVALLLWKRRR
jgi:hypothetical protein